MNKFNLILVLLIFGFSISVEAQINPECDVCGSGNQQLREADDRNNRVDTKDRITGGVCMYRDRDKDGFGTGRIICVRGNTTGYAFRNGDCNDNNANIKPKRWYRDADGDGVGTNSNSKMYCSPNNKYAGWSLRGGDCNDGNANITTQRTWYLDADRDNFGNPLVKKQSCQKPTDSQGNNYVLDHTDCDDSNPRVRYITWYKDQDGDNLGDPSISKRACNSGSGWVRNANDNCPTFKGAASNSGCPTGANTREARNSVYAKGYLINKKVISESKSYYDDLGKLEQTLSLDIKTNKVWASQTMYDTQGRPALQTLSSPAYNRNIFLYKENFIRKPNGTAFTQSDFETGNVLEPSTVGNQPNSLGYYYSNSNTAEPLQDITDRPYSRTTYSELAPGTVKQVIGGNKQNGAWRQGYKFSMPVAQEMYYAFGYDYFGNNAGSYENFLPAKGKKLREYSFSYVNPTTCKEVPAVYGDDAPDPIIGEPIPIYLHPLYELEVGAIYLVRNSYSKDNLRYVRLTSDRTSKSTREQERFISELVSTRKFFNCTKEMSELLHEYKPYLKFLNLYKSKDNQTFNKGCGLF